MNNIGVIFAMKEELDEVLNNITLVENINIFDLSFYKCTYNNKNLILVESGIGKVNSSRATQILIDNMNIDCIFNVGVAGSVNEKVKVLDLVIGEKLVQHDFNLKAFNRLRGDIPNVGIFIESDNYLISIAEEINTSTNKHKGVIASGDIFCTDEEMSKKIGTKFNALCVEMEGASIAQTCYLSHIPFLVIRSISDNVYEKDNNIKYEELLEKSSKIVGKYILEIIKKL